MNPTPFQDARANDLLARVSEDLSLLRQDVGRLLSHTTSHTLPAGMRDLADGARHRLAAGRLYSAEQLRALREELNRPATAWVGGALAVGVIAAGIYLFCKENGCAACCDDLEEDA